MLIEIPGCKFRVAGAGNEWQVQYPKKRNGTETWEGRYFFNRIEAAVDKAYELALREEGVTVEPADVPDQCRKVAKKMERAVKAAVACR